jgi:hypothetical protein
LRKVGKRGSEAITVKLIYWTCLGAIFIALAAEGVLLLIFGAWLPEAPRPDHVVACAWGLTCLSVVLHKRYGSAVILAAWLNAVAFFYLYLKAKTFSLSPSFWQANRFPMLLLLASHVGYLVREQRNSV